MPHFDKLVSSPIATLLMEQNLYLPSVVSSIIVSLCIVLLRKVKEPIQAPNIMSYETRQSSEPLLNDDDQFQIMRGSNSAPSVNYPVEARSDSPLDPSGSTSGDRSPVTKASVSPTLHHFKKIITYIRHKPVFGFCYLAFYLKSVAMASEAFVFQYFSERFGWPLPETTILRFALSSGAVLATLMIGPLVSSELARRAVPTPTIDLGIICVSLSALTICFVVAWRADSSTMFILCMCAQCISHGFHAY